MMYRGLARGCLGEARGQEGEGEGCETRGKGQHGWVTINSGTGSILYKMGGRDGKKDKL